MKKRILFSRIIMGILLCLCVESFSVEANGKNEVSDIDKEVYQELYMKKLEKVKKYNYHFQLDYFNDDDLPELFIFDGELAAHVDGADVYTCCDGLLVHLGKWGSWGDITYARKSDFFASCSYGMGVATKTFYEVERDHVIKGDCIVDNMNDPNNRYCTLNGKRISASEYNKIYNRDKDVRYITKNYYDVYPITDANISREFAKFTFADYERVDEIECLRLYSDFIKNNMDEAMLSCCEFLLTDLDENGMPEMFVKEGAASAYFCMIHDGKVVNLAQDMLTWVWIQNIPGTNEICIYSEYDGILIKYGYIENNTFVLTDAYETKLEKDGTQKLYHNDEPTDSGVPLNDGYDNMENLVGFGVLTTYEKAVYYYFNETLDGFSEEEVKNLLKN